MSPLDRPVRRLALVALAVLVALGAAGCGSDEGAGSDGDIGEPAAVEQTTSTASTTTAGPTTTVPPVGADTPQDAANTLYAAFVAGDRAAAAAVAESPAIDAVFGATPGPYQPYRGCDTGEFDTSGCLFRDRSTNNTIQFDLERRDAKWVVTGAFFSPG